MSKSYPRNKINHAMKLIDELKKKLEKEDAVVSFIVYGSYSDKSDHPPTEYSDVDFEIVAKDDKYKKFLDNFRGWFENKFEPVLLETSVSHLNKIFLTEDFLDLQFYISRLSEFDSLEKRELDYFPSGYKILFDKSNSIEEKIQFSLKPAEEKTPQEKFDRLNNSFWYFVQGTSPYLKRKEYWFAASGYWFWLYMILCKLLRMYYKKEVDYNPMKHIEKALGAEVIERIQPLRNLQTPEELKTKMRMLTDIYTDYAHKISKELNLKYNTNLEARVKEYIKQYLEG